MFTNKVYDILSKIQRWIPALGIFYIALAKIWNLPFGNEINNTIVALAALLAATLEVSSSHYYKDESKEIQASMGFAEAEGKKKK